MLQKQDKVFQFMVFAAILVAQTSARGRSGSNFEKEDDDKKEIETVQLVGYIVASLLCILGCCGYLNARMRDRIARSFIKEAKKKQKQKVKDLEAQQHMA